MNETSTLHQAYGNQADRIDGLDKLVGELNRWYLRQPVDNPFLHPCLIDGKPALVCQAGLSRNDSLAYAELQAIAQRYGIYLKEDNRRQDSAPAHNRRRNACLVLSFWVGMLATTRSVTADDLSSAQPVQVVASERPQPGYQRPVNMTVEIGTVIRLRRVQPPTTAEITAAYSQKQATLKSDQATVDDIANILKNLYHAEPADPATIQADLTAMAAYYGRYPQAIALINELRDQNCN